MIAKSETNHRVCSICKKSRLLKWFPLVYPDDPLDFRRLTTCRPCFKSVMRVVKATPQYKAYKQAPKKEYWRVYRSAMAMYRKAMQLQAMPYWANQNRINEMYSRAREMTKKTGIKHHVDHIIPLIHTHI